MKITSDNFSASYLQFRDRQAGVGVIYDPNSERYIYNAYCLETILLKELISKEFDYLGDALEFINDEFGSWELKDLEPKKNCSTCVAK